MDDLNAPQYVDFNNSSFLQMGDDSFFGPVERSEHERRFSEGDDFNACKDAVDSKPIKKFTKSLGTPKPIGLSTPMKNDIVNSTGRKQRIIRHSATPHCIEHRKIAINEEKFIINSAEKKIDEKKPLREKNIAVNDENSIVKLTEKKIDDKKPLREKNLTNDENLTVEETEKRNDAKKLVKQKNVDVGDKNMIIKESLKKVDAKNLVKPKNVDVNDKNLIIKETEKKIDAKLLQQKNVDVGDKNLIIKETEKKIDDKKLSKPKNVATENKNSIIKESEKKIEDKTHLREKNDNPDKNISKEKTENKDSKNVVKLEGAKGKVAILSKQRPKSAKENIPIQPAAVTKARVLASIKSRRQSISKARRRSTKFVSLAESVSAFQTAIPQRFLSTNSKDYQAGPLKRTKQAMKLTCPKSPALCCKFRTRVVSAPNDDRQRSNEPRKTFVNPNFPKKESSSTLREASTNLRRSISFPSISTTQQKQRFGSASGKDSQAGPLKKTKKVTCPQSPALLCKFRARAVSEDPKKPSQINDSRKACVGANSAKNSSNIREAATKLRRSLSVPAMTKKALLPPEKIQPKIETRMIKKPQRIIKNPPKLIKNPLKTVPNPPKTVQNPPKVLKNPSKIVSNPPKKSSAIANMLRSTSSSKTLMNAPKIPAKNQTLPSTAPKTPMKLQNLCQTLDKMMDKSVLSSSISLKKTPAKTLVHSVVSTKNDGLIVEQVEIGSFGIPIDKRYQDKKITRPIPFSFEARSKVCKAADETKNQKEMRKTICPGVKTSTTVKSLNRSSK